MTKWGLPWKCELGSTYEKQCNTSHKKNKGEKSRPFQSMRIKYLTKSSNFLYWNTQQSCTISNFLNLIMGIYEKHTADFILTGETLSIFPLISRLKQGCPLSPVLFNTVPEAFRQRKEVKFSISADNITLYTEHPMESSKKKNLLELIKKFGQVERYKINI